MIILIFKTDKKYRFLTSVISAGMRHDFDTLAAAAITSAAPPPDIMMHMASNDNKRTDHDSLKMSC